VNKVKTLQSQKSPQEEAKDYIFINVQKKKVKLLFSEIIYIESQQEYIKVVTTRKTFFSKLTTSEMESLLPSHLFKRIHRSYIVSVSRIDFYTAEAVEVGGISIPIGRSYRGILNNL
jgi:DNA-binding LytR/AlgR family response regulator